MSELKLIGEGVVMSDEEPKTAALFERMQSIAGRDLRELLGDQEQVACHHTLQGIVFLNRILQCLAADAQRGGRNLDDMIHKSAIEPVCREQAKQAFSTDRRNFDAPPILHGFDERHDAAVDEIGVFDRGGGRIDDLPGRELDVFAVTQYFIADCAWQREKNAIEEFFARATQRPCPGGGERVNRALSNFFFAPKYPLPCDRTNLSAARQFGFNFL